MIITYNANRQVSQMQALPVESYNRLSYMLYVFEHNTQFLLIHVPYTPIVVFWYIINMSP